MEIEYIYEDGDKSLLDGSLQRKGVIACPYCSYSYPYYVDIKDRCDHWYDTTEDLMQVIMQDYRCKRDGVILVSRCGDCGNISWVHRSFRGITDDAIEHGLINMFKIETEHQKRVVFAKKEWDNSLCKTCQCVKHTNEKQLNYYMFGVWVDCVQRYGKHPYSGIPKTKCKYYKEI
jgi:hypothetical protein